jgi:anti-sigma factor RsiW
MTDLDRVVAGLRCRDVLDDLSEFIDGTLSADRLGQIRAHVAECRECEAFGGRFARIIEAARSELGAVPDVTPAIAERLRARLRAERDQA